MSGATTHRRSAVAVAVCVAVALGGCAAAEPPAAGPESPQPAATEGGAATPGGEESPETAGTATTGDGTSGTPGSQRAVVAAIDGDRTGGCVDSGDARDVRSGGLAAGPFDEVASSWSSGSPGIRLYVVPEHPRSMPGLVVRGQLVGGADRFRGTHRATSRVADFSFYDVELDLPTSGTWRIRAASGPDSGCWTLTLD